MRGIADAFPRYTDHNPAAPVWCVTPKEGRVIHRFFDTSPFSPSGRYLALTRLPYEDRLPRHGDPAQIILVDLQRGQERVVAETRGWDTQLGAQAQWGADDSQLFFNDLDTATWTPHAVVMNPLTGQKRKLGGTVYMVSPDGRQLASPSLLRTARTQPGYGVIVPPERVPRNRGASPDDGLYVTDVATGRCRLLVSIAQIVEAVGDEINSDGDFYAFHVKWNSRGDRLMLVLRVLPRGGGRMQPNLVTLRADGTDIHLAIPARIWMRGGHHPNWCPDGDHLMMNLRLDRKAMRFVRARYDGSGLKPMTEAVLGSGHPSLHRDGRHIVTDAYPGEPVAFGDGTVPIRLVDVPTGQETTLVRIRTVPPYRGPKNELRVDPHPAWDRSFRWVAFNACPDATRRVFVAYLGEFLAP